MCSSPFYNCMSFGQEGWNNNNKKACLRMPQHSCFSWNTAAKNTVQATDTTLVLTFYFFCIKPITVKQLNWVGQMVPPHSDHILGRNHAVPETLQQQISVTGSHSTAAAQATLQCPASQSVITGGGEGIDAHTRATVEALLQRGGAVRMQSLCWCSGPESYWPEWPSSSDKKWWIRFCCAPDMHGGVGMEY